MTIAISAFGLNDCVSNNKNLICINKDLPSSLILPFEAYNNTIYGELATNSRIELGWGYPSESKLPNCDTLCDRNILDNPIDRYLIAALWKRFTQIVLWTKGSDAEIRKSPNKDIQIPSYIKSTKKKQYYLADLLCGFIKYLLNEFSERTGNTILDEPIVLSIPNDLDIYAQEYLLRSLRTNNLSNIRLLWRPIAALLSVLDDNKIKNLKNNSKVRVIYLGPDAIEFSIFQLRLDEKSGYLQPIRKVPKKSNLLSYLDIAFALINKTVKSTDNVIWQYINRSHELWRKLCGINSDNELELYFDGMWKQCADLSDFDLKTLKFSQNRIADSLFGRRPQQLNYNSWMDYFLENIDEIDSPIILCGPNANSEFAAQLEYNLKVKFSPKFTNSKYVYVYDKDIINQGCLIYQYRLDHGLPTYLDTLPDLSILYFAQKEQQIQWKELVKENQEVSPNQIYKGETFTQFGIKAGNSNLEVYLKSKSAYSDNNSGLRKGHVQFNRIAAENIPFEIHAEMSAASGLAKVIIKDSKGYLPLKGKIFDYSDMNIINEEDIPKPKKSYPEQLKFKVYTDINDPFWKKIQTYLQYRPNYNYIKIRDEVIGSLKQNKSFFKYIRGNNQLYKDKDLIKESKGNYILFKWFDVHGNSDNLTKDLLNRFILNINKDIKEGTLPLDSKNLVKLSWLYALAPGEVKSKYRNEIKSALGKDFHLKNFDKAARCLRSTEDIKNLFKIYALSERSHLNYYSRGLIYLLSEEQVSVSFLTENVANKIVENWYKSYKEGKFRSKFKNSSMLLTLSLIFRKTNQHFLEASEDQINNCNIEYPGNQILNKLEQIVKPNKSLQQHIELLSSYILSKGNPDLLTDLLTEEDEDNGENE